jgi:hypothetical protein
MAALDDLLGVLNLTHGLQQQVAAGALSVTAGARLAKLDSANQQAAFDQLVTDGGATVRAVTQHVRGVRGKKVRDVPTPKELHLWRDGLFIRRQQIVARNASAETVKFLDGIDYALAIILEGKKEDDKGEFAKAAELAALAVAEKAKVKADKKAEKAAKKAAKLAAKADKAKAKAEKKAAPKVKKAKKEKKP